MINYLGDITSNGLGQRNMYEIRQEQMKQFIHAREVVTMKELQQRFSDVSLMTIHRDLDALAAAGFAVKVRGGARSARHDGEQTFEVRAGENQPGKTRVAKKAIELMKGQSSIFLDSGTSCLALARIVPTTAAMVVTTGPNVAMALAAISGPTVTMCPGSLNKENLTVSGHSTLQFLETINIDFAFIGVSGYGRDAGFTCGKENEMMVKRLVISRARKTAVLCDQTKFRRLMPYTFATLDDIDYVITDGTPPEEFTEAAKSAGVTVL